MKTKKEGSLLELLNQCSAIDTRFNHIDLSCFDCRKETSNNCESKNSLSVEKVKECFEKARVISELVTSKLTTAD